ncbi:response regulator transcription factor [bacterium]|nr:response regulator transcription factor [candidate division CSSED10-310 bacterium]
MKSAPYILVVDDDSFILRVIKDSLETDGFRVDIASSAEDCYRMLGTRIPDLFVLDIMLPGQDGFTLCRNLRKSRTTEFTPVLMLSSKSRVRDCLNGLEAGADDYLIKPFHLDELVARIRALLRRSNRNNQVEPEDKRLVPSGSAAAASTQPRGAPGPKTLPKCDREAPQGKILQTPTDTSTPAPVKPIVKRPLSSPPLEIPAGMNFEAKKKLATELYQNREYDNALKLFETLSAENPKDHYSKKYVEVTRNTMMKIYLQALGSKDSIPIRTSTNPDDFIGLDFNTQEGFIFSRIDGITDFKGIVAISGMKPVLAYGILYNLFQSGVIKIRK